MRFQWRRGLNPRGRHAGALRTVARDERLAPVADKALIAVVQEALRPRRVDPLG
jgi:hypothetical protein